MHWLNSPIPTIFWGFLCKQLGRIQLSHCHSLQLKRKLCLLFTKWQTPYAPCEKGVTKMHAESIKEGQRWCLGNEDFSKWGKQRNKVVITVTAVYSEGKITTCAFTNQVGSESKIFNSLIFVRYLATSFPGGNTLVLKCLQEKVCPAWMRQPLQCALDWAASWHGCGARSRGSMGVCRHSWHVLGTNMSYARSCWASTMLQGKQPLVWKRKSQFVKFSRSTEFSG